MFCRFEFRKRVRRMKGREPETEDEIYGVCVEAFEPEDASSTKTMPPLDGVEAWPALPT